jgi:RNA recognition motif-containing protein
VLHSEAGYSLFNSFSQYLMNIYVGNLPWSLSDDDLQELFTEYGEVTNASIVADRDTGRSKGFGFVDMPDQSAGEMAVESLNGKTVDGRDIRVNEARKKEDRPSTSRY